MYKNYKNAKDKVKRTKGSELMIKKIAWNTFKNTGDINAFLELKQIENIEKQFKQNIIKPEFNKEITQQNDKIG